MFFALEKEIAVLLVVEFAVGIADIVAENTVAVRFAEFVCIEAQEQTFVVIAVVNFVQSNFVVCMPAGILHLD